MDQYKTSQPKWKRLILTLLGKNLWFLKNLREYDLATEKIRIGTDKIKDDGEYVVLAKHRAVGRLCIRVICLRPGCLIHRSLIKQSQRFPKSVLHSNKRYC